ncbi:MAG: Hsp20/alpha crystallin family protein [Calditrichia bacterium]|nr:Hsp20/alpha crystallin family protein [Calditrichota bacterium]MCB0269816.1 Hsp20/alpha crystallin family protein [Calditrichota bacterium]MCB0285120.1 Hsp20/alpha crystallin family protein [Calditrichota bacterium]MCB9066803.1 Hsp20/alpha crystallin family protein [Calditrichia bacterium]
MTDPKHHSLKPATSTSLQLISPVRADLLPRPRYYLVPEVEIIATAQEILLIIDMPGVPDEWLDVVLDRDQLTVEGIVRMPAEIAANERHFFAFRRQFRIEESIDRRKVSGSFRDGELRIHLPRQDGAKPVKIRIK